MKQYKLLKDLPFAKASEIFESKILDDNEEYLFWGEIKTKKIENFDEWFEEIKPFEIPDEFEMGFWTIAYHIKNGFYTWLCPSDAFKSSYEDNLKQHMEIGSAFKSKQEAENHIEWLKARAVLLEDTKGFKPDWSDISEEKYYGVWNAKTGELGCLSRMSIKHDDIYFETVDDIGYSFKTHEKEWKIYLGVED